MVVCMYALCGSTCVTTWLVGWLGCSPSKASGYWGMEQKTLTDFHAVPNEGAL